MTEQSEFWKGEFGDEYIRRNSDDLDASYKKKYGISRTDMNKECLSGLSKERRILEVGCNIGNQLVLLKGMGYQNLYGIEINRKALEIAKKEHLIDAIYGSAFDIPFKDGFFDMVFTSGVLIHIAPEDQMKAMAEMVRVTRRYVWGFEYYSPECEEILYRGNKNRLWKNDFANQFLDNFNVLKLTCSKKYRYLDSNNVDIMYLLEKR